ncbi:uncharacterized protein LOC132755083 [Ruditapes philippinarum]|uniref:uncharacterized protein LOC132755083 n=1 Tax=Ruditapes philippinarum TaxID=129788 RepID=UPI00295ACED2|nr:uncharacterized protein LOC132755083 [Ruditapes philippinarum]
MSDVRVHRQRGKRGGKLKSLNKPQGPNLNNLIYPKRTNTVSCKNEKVTCATLNCRSAIRKDSFIGQILREEKIDFAILTETWFSDHKQHQFETSDLNQYGYKLSVTNRPNRIGGGIALTHRTTSNSRRISNGVTRSFEFGIWQLILKNITLHIMGVYRPPSLATNSQFVSDFSEFIENIVPQYSNLMIMGDFNLHIDDSSSVTADFKDSLFAMGLTQHVDFSTHIGGNILDLVITEATNGVEVLLCEPGTLVSDHYVVKVTLNVKKENILSKTFKTRSWRDVNEPALIQEFENIDIDTDDVDTYTKICRAPKPWFNENIVVLKRELRKAERLWTKYKEPEQLQTYKNLRNKYCHAIEREKTLTLSEKVSNSKGDSKKLYALVSELTGTKSENPMPSGISDSTLSDNFADYFMNKISKIRDSLHEFNKIQAN